MSYDPITGLHHVVISRHSLGVIIDSLNFAKDCAVIEDRDPDIESDLDAVLQIARSWKRMEG